ncbi:MAG: hypothetical protein AUK55_14920 [Syntrophobacteraceae bacterium CG2_30_61_12]|nr:MAG: hypothetical protein AUK55_14920 [Syntrophobacteraceae bacterium CG2_30_61_12]
MNQEVPNPYCPTHNESAAEAQAPAPIAHAHHPSSHHHADPEDQSGSRLLFTITLNLLIPAAQVAGGLYAHSVALISDAAHNFSDFSALVIAYIAYRIGRKGASVRNTFGYRRAEILAALLNVVLLVGAVLFIVYHAVHRFQHPQPVSGVLVVGIAAIGVVGNGLSALLLHRDADHSLNVRGAFLHMMGDLLTSVAVLINGLVLIYLPWYWLDPLLSLLIVGFILKNCWSILTEAAAILMNATPKGLDLEAVKGFLEGLPEILGVHYLHAWNTSSSGIAFSCHVVVPEQPLSQTEALIRRVRRHLLDRFRIDHPILQLETRACGNGSLLCELSCNGQAEPDRNGARRSAPGKPPPPPTERPNLARVLQPAARLLLGAVFIYAAYDKILDPAAFARAIYNYQILPDSVINVTAIVLPWLELLVGAALILGVWQPGAVFLANAMLLFFTAALAFSVACGLDVDCGCFGSSGEAVRQGSMLWSLVRDILLLVPSLYLLITLGRDRHKRHPADAVSDGAA